MVGKRKLCSVVFALALSSTIFAAEGNLNSSKDFLFSGRWEHGASFCRTSAPAAMVQFNAQASSLEFEIEGQARWRVDQDGEQIGLFISGDKARHKVKVAADGKPHLYRLIKISESNPGGVTLFGIKTDAKGKFLDAPKHNSRRIEFIGDSFTVGYGVEGHVSDQEDHVFETTNASKSYAFLLADGYKANFQVNAFSGRGLVRNYDNIVSEWKIPRLYQYTVPGEAPVDVAKLSNPADSSKLMWNFEDFHPQVIVVFLGINDFQGNPPYGDKGEFKKTYAEMLNKLRSAHPGVKFLLVSTKIWPNDDLTPTVKQVYDAEIAAGKKDVEFVTVQTVNEGLHGHPNEPSQKELADTLRPIIGRLSGWMRR